MRIFGHGATHGEGPAINSRASFVELQALGVDGVELDVRRTADDQLVLSHDDHYADGRSIDRTTARDRPSGILLLSDALDLCRGLVVNIELKNHPSERTFDRDERIADLCVGLLEDRGGVDDVIVSSFGLGCIDRVLGVRPQTPTALLLLSRRPPSDVVVADVSERHRAVHPFVSMVDTVFMKRCAQFDLQVNVWSAEAGQAHTVRTLLELGVDGLITEAASEAIDIRSLHALD